LTILSSFSQKQEKESSAENRSKCAGNYPFGPKVAQTFPTQTKYFLYVLNLLKEKMVAGAGFEPTTFGL
jgi:hypothetical protein